MCALSAKVVFSKDSACRAGLRMRYSIPPLWHRHLYKAQEEQDVFGAPLQQAAEEQENDVEEPKEKASLRGMWSCPTSKL